MVSVRVHDGKTADVVDFPKIGDGNDHIVETAIAAKIIFTGMMAPCADEGKGIVDLTGTDLFPGQNHTSY